MRASAQRSDFEWGVVPVARGQNDGVSVARPARAVQTRNTTDIRQATVAPVEQRGGMSTVLAQDHFYRDFLSLHMSKETQTSAMMMPCIIAPPSICALVHASGGMNLWCSDVLNGIHISVTAPKRYRCSMLTSRLRAQTHSSPHISVALYVVEALGVGYFLKFLQTPSTHPAILLMRGSTPRQNSATCSQIETGRLCASMVG
jgi:hypothetical protein